MNNILSFEDFILEDKRKWKKIEITPKSPEDGSVEIESDGKLDETSEEAVQDILADDYEMLVTVTGKNNVGGFMETVRNYLPYIATMKNDSNEQNRMFTGKDGTIEKMEHNEIKVKLEKSENGKRPKRIITKLDNKINITPILFDLCPPKSRNMGKGELLLASYYTNIKRSLEKNAGGDPGDCIILSKNGKDIDGFIEVKTADAQFPSIDCFKHINENEKENIINKRINEDKCEIKFTYAKKMSDVKNKDDFEFREFIDSDDVDLDNKTTIKITHETNIPAKKIRHIINTCIGGISAYIKSQSKEKDNFYFVMFENKNDETNDNIKYKSIEIKKSDSIDNIMTKLMNSVNKIKVTLPRDVHENRFSFNKFKMSIINNEMYINGFVLV